jgi:hypothetical protein
MIIKASEFVKRQTRESEFSYFTSSWNALEDIATSLFNDGLIRTGYREGVILIDVPEVTLNMFMSALVPITDDLVFKTEFVARREGEEKLSKSVAYGKKQPAKSAFIVLYSKEVLSEDPLNELTGADYEIISINASPTLEEPPMRPATMARNFLADTEQGKGGTKGEYTAKQFAESIMFWKKHTLIKEEV